MKITQNDQQAVEAEPSRMHRATSKSCSPVEFRELVARMDLADDEQHRASPGPYVEQDLIHETFADDGSPFWFDYDARANRYR